MSEEKPVFKCVKKKRNLRSKDEYDEPNGEEVVQSVLQDTKELQKLRKRPNGVSVVGLALGKKLSAQEELIIDDPFKLKTGDMKALKGKKPSTDDSAVNLGNTFSVETNQRDEDADMMKYIEEELAKRKGQQQSTEEKTDDKPNVEDLLFQVPEHMRRSSQNKSEEMLSNQILSGIPEVDLGINERIRNIEATEEAKLKLLQDRIRNRNKQNDMTFVPTNIAVNFVQHNRFNLDPDGPSFAAKKRRKPPSPEVVVKPIVQITDTVEPNRVAAVPSTSTLSAPKPHQNATDDMHYEKFKKQFRRR